MNTANDIIHAREKRSKQIQALISEYSTPLISLSLNIPGANKNASVFSDVFQEGVRQLDALIAAMDFNIQRRETHASEDGDICFWLVDKDAIYLKRLCLTIETSHALGRLFDFDVFDRHGKAIKRKALHSPPRNCMVCGRNVHNCRFLARHTLSDVMAKITEIIDEWRAGSADRIFQHIARLANWAMQFEIGVTPKPGLVDRNNSGAHKDMNYFSFVKTIPILAEEFYRCAELGYTAEKCSPELLDGIRAIGIKAEWQMTQLTYGVNTLKGLIFSGALLATVSGYLYGKGLLPTPELLQVYIISICRNMVQSELAIYHKKETIDNSRLSFGQKIYLERGITGIRGEAENGFPSLFQFGLPTFRTVIREGFPADIAAISALFAIMSNLDDTNLIKRGGVDVLRSIQKTSTQIVEDRAWHREDFLPMVEKLDREFIERNYSPGGAADLLSLVVWVYLFENGNIGMNKGVKLKSLDNVISTGSVN